MSWNHVKQETWKCSRCAPTTHYKVVLERSPNGTWAVDTYIDRGAGAGARVKRGEACEEEGTARRIAERARAEHDQLFHTESLWDHGEGQR